MPFSSNWLSKKEILTMTWLQTHSHKVNPYNGKFCNCCLKLFQNYNKGFGFFSLLVSQPDSKSLCWSIWSPAHLSHQHLGWKHWEHTQDTKLGRMPDKDLKWIWRDRMRDGTWNSTRNLLEMNVKFCPFIPKSPLQWGAGLLSPR